MEPMLFWTTALGQDYGKLLAQVCRHGNLVKPRGLLCKEAEPLIIHLVEPRRCLVNRPGFSRALMWLEIAQLVAGVHRPDLMATVSPNAAGLVTPYGAYGPRTREQFTEVIDELTRDPHSRRALVYVGRPDDLRLAARYDPTQLDMPCTTTWQFLVRDGRLDMVVTMRSWDLVWGLAYDVPCFVAMQQVAAAALGVPLGEYVHIAGSGHVYDRHWELEPSPCADQLFVTAADKLEDTRRYALAALDTLAKAHEPGGVAKMQRMADGRATGIGWADALRIWAQLKRLTASEPS